MNETIARTREVGVRVVVTGGREFFDVPKAFSFLDFVHTQITISFLGQGGARGLDFLARKWAEKTGIPTQQWDADWDRYGNAAGNMRNGRMLHEAQPDLLLAFAGDRGTANCVDQARKMEIPICRCDW